MMNLSNIKLFILFSILQFTVATITLSLLATISSISCESVFNNPFVLAVAIVNAYFIVCFVIISLVWRK